MSFPGKFMLLLGLVMSLGSGCSREDPSESVRSALSEATNAVAAKPPSAAEDRIREGGPEGYVGSEACRTCHEDQFSSWHRTYHRTMTQFPSTQAIRANFRGVVLTNDQTRFRLSQEGEEFRVRLERIQETGNPEPAPSLDTQISLVTGSHHMQVFWVPGGDGNVQVGFPFTWLIPEQRWVPRNSTFLRPPGFHHQAEAWNVMCSRCHATAIEPRVDSAARRMDSRAAELGISCEACHGPGERHVQLRTAAGPQGPKPTAEVLAREIVHPEKIDPVRSAETCGFCHSMKWIDRTENWRTEGFRFRPGDVLAETTPLIQPGRTDAIPGLKEYLARNPTLLEDYFWKDGMGRVSGREFNSLAESPCFAGGKFSCLSCHSLHESEPADLLAENRKDNRACIQCHETYRDPVVLQKHTHHLPTSSGSECYNCHMPHTTYGVLSAIRSHQISNPSVAVELTTGRPNACNLCHLDQTLAWTAEHLNQWYGQPIPALDETARTVANSARLILTGDAGQRALMAWHLGWAPARSVSGTNWLAPYLGLLLDDPYAAVRCVGERSLKLTPQWLPAGYDFVVPPGERSSAVDAVWKLWQAAGPLAGEWPAPLALESGATGGPGPKWEALLRNRDNRPVRLRE
ncbi:MAG: hypothetical protein J0M24_08080 [Verrucomicrobia bacterium]|nr:hypothetical protein [Verrucomicrobiota bacterium]